MAEEQSSMINELIKRGLSKEQIKAISQMPGLARELRKNEERGDRADDFRDTGPAKGRRVSNGRIFVAANALEQMGNAAKMGVGQYKGNQLETEAQDIVRRQGERRLNMLGALGDPIAEAAGPGAGPPRTGGPMAQGSPESAAVTTPLPQPQQPQLNPLPAPQGAPSPMSQALRSPGNDQGMPMMSGGGAQPAPVPPQAPSGPMGISNTPYLPGSIQDMWQKYQQQMANSLRKG